MKVLRQNSQTIITILEVLLYDPLYAWTVTSAEANKRQTDEDVEYRASGSSEEGMFWIHKKTITCYFIIYLTLLN